MIKKLQIRFIALTMLSLLAVLAVILAGMNIVNYRSVIHQCDSLLELLSENEGKFPSFGGPMGKLPPNMSPEVPYETRYFTVSVDPATGKVLKTDTGRIAAVDAATAIEYARQAKDERGFVGHFRYLRYTDGTAQQLLFLDCGRRLESFQNFLLASLGISLMGYLVVFLLVVFFSTRIVRPLSESYEKQKRFITDAGHELKTPLTIIRADADVLEMEHGSNEWLTDIQKQTDRLSALTADLVYLARMEETDRPLTMLDFALSDVVAETAQSFMALAQNKTFTQNITPMLSMRGNEKAIAQLTSILLDNALKYSPPGGSISLSLEKQGRSTVLTVCNTTAETYSKHQLSKLFDRFYRGDSARTSHGYGIGLSIAKAIVSGHNGRITADSPTEGTLRICAQFPHG